MKGIQSIKIPSALGHKYRLSGMDIQLTWSNLLQWQIHDYTEDCGKKSYCIAVCRKKLQLHQIHVNKDNTKLHCQIYFNFLKLSYIIYSIICHCSIFILHYMELYCWKINYLELSYELHLNQFVCLLTLVILLKQVWELLRINMQIFIFFF